jgi:hypothetical protein
MFRHVHPQRKNIGRWAVDMHAGESSFFEDATVVRWAFYCVKEGSDL